MGPGLDSGKQLKTARIAGFPVLSPAPTAPWVNPGRWKSCEILAGRFPEKLFSPQRCGPQCRQPVRKLL
jgi:hypothetical protein